MSPLPCPKTIPPGAGNPGDDDITAIVILTHDRCALSLCGKAGTVRGSEDTAVNKKGNKRTNKIYTDICMYVYIYTHIYIFIYICPCIDFYEKKGREAFLEEISLLI